MSAVPARAAQDSVLDSGAYLPSVHGSVRMSLETDGDTVLRATPSLGWVHRGIEKLAENRAYGEVPALLDRADHLAAMHTETAYAMALERLAGIGVPPKALWARSLVMEVGRIASHLAWLGGWALDAGMTGVSARAMREREAMAGILEALSGKRAMFEYVRAGGVSRDLPGGVGASAGALLKAFEHDVDDLAAELTRGGIFARRARDEGAVDRRTALASGATGPSLRACGVAFDVRRSLPYAAYSNLDFGMPLGTTGDCWDRCMVRMEEMRWAARMARRLLEGMPEGAYATPVVGDIRPAAGEAYASVESPRGELGVHLVSDGTQRPYRMRLRSPSFYNLGVAAEALAGASLDSARFVLGSFDLVAGEIER